MAGDTSKPALVSKTFCGIAALPKYKVEVILAAWADVLALRKAGEFIPSDFHPTVLQKRGKADTVPGDTSSRNL